MSEVAFSPQLGTKIQQMMNNLRREIFRQMLENEDLLQTNRFLKNQNTKLKNQINNLHKNQELETTKSTKSIEDLQKRNNLLQETISKLTKKNKTFAESQKKQLKKISVRQNKDKVEWMLNQFKRYEHVHSRLAVFSKKMKSIKRNHKKIHRLFQKKLLDAESEKTFLKKYISVLEERRGNSKNDLKLFISNKEEKSEQLYIKKQLLSSNTHDFENTNFLNSQGLMRHKLQGSYQRAKGEIPWVYKTGYKDINIDELLHMKDDATRKNSKEVDFRFLQGDKNESTKEIDKRWHQIQAKISQYID